MILRKMLNDFHYARVRDPRIEKYFETCRGGGLYLP